MARTVEQLQLSVEEDDLRERNEAGEALIRRMAFLRPSTCWVEVEEATTRLLDCLLNGSILQSVYRVEC